MVDGLLEETQRFHATRSQARGRLQVLDIAILSRAQRQHGERASWLEVHAEQFRRWRALSLAPPQWETVDRRSWDVEAPRLVEQVFGAGGRAALRERPPAAGEKRGGAGAGRTERRADEARSLTFGA